MRHIIISLIAIVTVSFPLIAQSNYWTAVNAPEGGSISSVGITKSGALYASDHYSSNLWNYNKDQEKWIKNNSPIEFRRIVTEDSHGRLFAEIGQYFYQTSYAVSDDGGVSWAAFETPLDLQNLWALENRSLVGYADSAYHISNDDGASWRSILRADQGYDRTIHFAPNGDMYFKNSDRSFLSSTDMGQTWQGMTIDATYPSQSYFSIGQPLFDNESNAYLFSRIATNKSLYVSNSETGWTKKSMPFHCNNAYINHGGMLFATVQSDYGKLYRSQTQGDTWVLLGLPSQINYISGIHFEGDNIFLISNDSIYHSPDNGDNWEVGYSMPRSYARLTITPDLEFYLSNYGEGVFKSEDLGETWEEFNTGIQNHSIASITQDSQDRLYANVGHRGPYTSEDNGSTWTRYNYDELHSIVAADNGTLYAFNGAGYDTRVIVYSVNDGASWQEVNWGFEDYPSKFIIDNMGYLVVFAINRESWNEVIYRSNDLGEKWKIIAPDLSDGDYSGITTFFESKEGNYLLHVYYSFDWGNKAFLSTDQGLTWTEATTKGSEFHQNNSGRIFSYGLESGLFYRNINFDYSDDGGVTWVKKDLVGEVSFSSLPKMFFDSDVNIYSISNDTLRFSSDGANSWSVLSVNEINKQIKNLSFLNEGEIYALTNRNDIYSSWAPEVVLSSEMQRLANLNVRTYPNPLTDYSVVEYNLHSGSQINLQVLDAHGRPIKILIDSFQETGNHQVIWNRKDQFGQYVPSGLYFYSLRVDDRRKVFRVVVD
ncbi:MAG: T9SS type A sorting domain-containing protein [Cyclobacteriaceae bacterium]